MEKSLRWAGVTDSYSGQEYDILVAALAGKGSHEEQNHVEHCLTMPPIAVIMAIVAQLSQKRKIGRRKRARTLGQAIGLGLAATLGIGLVLFGALMLIPGTALPNFFLLAHNASSNTLRSDPLFQEWAESIQREEALFGTPLSLLCGGLTLGWQAPSYATARRVLWSGAGMALGLLAVCLAFLWPVTVIQQNLLNAQEGGRVILVTADGPLILRQALWSFIWTLVCVLGTWLGLRLRARTVKNAPAAPALKTAGQ